MISQDLCSPQDQGGLVRISSILFQIAPDQIICQLFAYLPGSSCRYFLWIKTIKVTGRQGIRGADWVVPKPWRDISCIEGVKSALNLLVTLVELFGITNSSCYDLF